MKLMRYIKYNSYQRAGTLSWSIPALFLLFIYFSTSSCRKVPEPAYSLNYINGEWMRTDGQKLEYDSMRINIQNGTGKITAIPSGYTEYFQVGILKWINITPVGRDDADYLMFDLSSTEEYASPVHIQVLDENTIFILHPNLDWVGTEQIWKRL